MTLLTGGGVRRPVASAPSTSTHPTLDTSALTARIAGLENEAEALQTRLREAERERQKAERERQKAEREREKAEEDKDAEAQARGALEEQR
jgi:chromosome segregation ATPase